MANAGMVALDWQQRINWDRLRKYRLERARARMKAAGLGAMLLMYDENVRYVTSTLTPGWNRLKPGLRYAMLCGDDAPVLFEQGDIGMQIERHAQVVCFASQGRRTRGRGEDTVDAEFHVCTRQHAVRLIRRIAIPWTIDNEAAGL